MAKRPYRALLWDNDGVLVDTEGLYFEATRGVLADVGVEFTQAEYVELFLVDNRGLSHFADRLGGTIGVDQLRVKRNRRYSELLFGQDVVIPGASAALTAVAPHYRMAMVTSSSREHLAIAHERSGFLRHFELLLAEGDYPRSKPHPDPYLEAVRRLGVAADECLVIEDSRRGLLSAKAAGLTCWVVPGALSGHASLAEADRFLRDLSELPIALGLP
ncbi:MAG: HAD family phosphatase [Polyangiaceae bacterium]|jgi:HAD superfamily hydrolase (TIGR01509 family)